VEECITAGELRTIGYEIDAQVPEYAMVARKDCELRLTPTPIINFNAPFAWAGGGQYMVKQAYKKN
jgi:hypothetical protein